MESTHKQYYKNKISSSNVVVWHQIWICSNQNLSAGQSREGEKLQLISKTFCCCHWLRMKVGAVKLSLITVLAKTANGLRLMLSSCQSSLSFGLDDKDNPVKFFSPFFQARSEVLCLWCHDWYGIAGAVPDIYFNQMYLHSWTLYQGLSICKNAMRLCFNDILHRMYGLDWHVHTHKRQSW